MPGRLADGRNSNAIKLSILAEGSGPGCLDNCPADHARPTRGFGAEHTPLGIYLERDRDSTPPVVERALQFASHRCLPAQQSRLAKRERSPGYFRQATNGFAPVGGRTLGTYHRDQPQKFRDQLPRATLETIDNASAQEKCHPNLRLPTEVSAVTR
jgi:hypothetical protein